VTTSQGRGRRQTLSDASEASKTVQRTKKDGVGIHDIPPESASSHMMTVADKPARSMKKDMTCGTCHRTFSSRLIAATSPILLASVNS
jgi:hypothetical protein